VNMTVGVTCAAGFYCPPGSDVPIATPAGTYITITGSTSHLDQINCGLGKYCPAGSSAPIDCPAGYYSDELRLGACKLCPAGYSCAGPA